MVFVARRLHSDRDRYCGHGIQPGLSASSLTDLTALCGHHFRHTGAPADRGFLSLEGAADVGGGEMLVLVPIRFADGPRRVIGYWQPTSTRYRALQSKDPACPMRKGGGPPATPAITTQHAIPGEPEALKKSIQLAALRRVLPCAVGLCAPCPARRITDSVGGRFCVPSGLARSASIRFSGEKITPVEHPKPKTTQHAENPLFPRLECDDVLAGREHDTADRQLPRSMRFHYRGADMRDRDPEARRPSASYRRTASTNACGSAVEVRFGSRDRPADCRSHEASPGEQ